VNINLPKRRRYTRQAFVYVVCGNAHAERLNTSLKFLKKYTHKEIVVIASRISTSIDHDQLIHIPPNPDFDDHQMAITIKTEILQYLKDPALQGCYLDTDVIAVNKKVDSIFTHIKGPFAFAQDLYPISTFSRYAVNCGCTKSKCDHLIQAIRNKFKVEVSDPEWPHWNGGVFLFSSEAKPLLDLWSRYSKAIFNDSHWKTRDQGTLIAAVWRLGLQGTPTLAAKYNFIVDRFEGIPLEKRSSAQTIQAIFNNSYSLRPQKRKPTPVLIHFINDGVQCRGWKNWEDVEELLKDASPALPAKTPSIISSPRALSRSNRVVHSLWIGNQLSKLEQLTVHSFLNHGHEFHLWLYDDLETPLPREVILEDANDIIPRSQIFRRKSTDAETGVGRGSVGSPFSDLFRYKLLYEKGGYWVDMDVTCLKPFNFKGDYLFRSHRVGVVGNIMKCPPGSPLMKMTYDQVKQEANEESPWLMPNRVLSRNIGRLKLERFIQHNICNEDKWGEIILPFIETDLPIPEQWFGIHWINEMWRTLQEDAGWYRGKQYVNQVPNKEAIPPFTTLGCLYKQYSLDVPPSCEEGGEIIQRAENSVMQPPLVTSMQRQPPSIRIQGLSHLNVLLPSLAMGGAERSVVDVLNGLPKDSSTAKLFVLNDVKPSYDFEETDRIRLYRLHNLNMDLKLRTVAFEVLGSAVPVLFTHLVHVKYLRTLWALGVKTVPVIQNSKPSWQDPPRAFDDPHVPFVVAVSEDVAEQLRASRCPKPVVAVRHELQRWFKAEEVQTMRQEVRARHAVGDNTLLIGMVGEFKSQKAYTRAVRVLAEIRRRQPAKLMILGGWDHRWGNGRTAYTAACRQALDLGVMPDLLTIGPVKNVAPYYAAFDVFLNTSIYEGLSVATLEAVAAGCPIVSADAGGNRESLREDSMVVRQSADISSYVSAIDQVLSEGQRSVPRPPPNRDLVPRLWSYLGQYGVLDTYTWEKKRTINLFLSDNLSLGGAPRSLVNLLCRLPPEAEPWLGVLYQSNHQAFLDEVESAGIPVFSTGPAGTYLDHAERILIMIQRIGARNVVFWNLDARVKLLLAKILPKDQVRLIDVSPGSWLFQDLNNNAELQQRITFNFGEYFKRIDKFVSKYKGGGPPGVTLAPGKLVVIPNGVPDFAVNSPETLHIGLEPDASQDFVIGTCCRILPNRQIEFFVEMLAELNRRLPGVTMRLVGAAYPKYEDYWLSVCQHARTLGVTNLHFSGPKEDVVPYLRQFQVFVLLGTDHGCPNASLEAMSVGLPVVAASHGGVMEQILPGVNGFLVSDKDPKEMAHRVRMLLMNREMRRRFGEASRKIALEKFSMDLMVKRYMALLNPCVKEKSK
jgi:glycosyltransferase involved in cell wall biosynthesis